MTARAALPVPPVVHFATRGTAAGCGKSPKNTYFAGIFFCTHLRMLCAGVADEIDAPRRAAIAMPDFAASKTDPQDADFLIIKSL
jgi:hypothetical protein